MPWSRVVRDWGNPKRKSSPLKPKFKWIAWIFFYFHDHNGWGPSAHCEYLRPPFLIRWPGSSSNPMQSPVCSLYPLQQLPWAPLLHHDSIPRYYLRPQPSTIDVWGLQERQEEDSAMLAKLVLSLCALSRRALVSTFNLLNQTGFKYCCALSSFLIPFSLASVHKAHNYFHFLWWHMQTSRS